MRLPRSRSLALLLVRFSSSFTCFLSDFFTSFFTHQACVCIFSNSFRPSPFFTFQPDWAYDQWAIRRLQITGRPDLEVILRERQEAAAAKKDADCEDKGECEIDWDKM